MRVLNLTDESVFLAKHHRSCWMPPLLLSVPVPGCVFKRESCVSQCPMLPSFCFEDLPFLPYQKSTPLLGLLLASLITCSTLSCSRFSLRESPPLPLLGDNVKCHLGPSSWMDLLAQMLGLHWADSFACYSFQDCFSCRELAAFS